MSVIKVTSANFEQEVLQSEQPVLVDFWAVWCGPCKMLSPIVEEVANEAEGFKVCSIDVDENQDLAMQYKVTAIPTLLVFKNGEVANRSMGFIQKAQVLALLQ